MPNVGFYFEKSATDLKNNYLVENTGGGLIAVTLGLDVFFKNISLGFNYQNPLAQNLADGQIKAQNRTLLHLTYLF